MKRWLTRLWRRIRNRCELCGRKRIPFKVNDIHSWGPFCRYCNKTQNFGRAYGAGAAKLAAMMERDRRSDQVISSTSLTLDDIRRTIAALPPPPPIVRFSPYVPHGKAYKYAVPKWLRGPNDPEEVILVNPEDLA